MPVADTFGEEPLSNRLWSLLVWLHSGTFDWPSFRRARILEVLNISVQHLPLPLPLPQAVVPSVAPIRGMLLLDMTMHPNRSRQPSLSYYSIILLTNAYLFQISGKGIISCEVQLLPNKDPGGSVLPPGSWVELIG
ncbi:hypothetical protein N665_0105s0021 [Sinapis alba]|nr:hypothetical protein N665_0105s0021 [Sinapis alba]